MNYQIDKFTVSVMISYTIPSPERFKLKFSIIHCRKSNGIVVIEDKSYFIVDKIVTVLHFLLFLLPNALNSPLSQNTMLKAHSKSPGGNWRRQYLLILLIKQIPYHSYDASCLVFILFFGFFYFYNILSPSSMFADHSN